jgi:hypothetical protein
MRSVRIVLEVARMDALDGRADGGAGLVGELSR